MYEKWELRILYIGYNYVVYVLKVKISWNCFMVLSDIEDKLYFRDRYFLLVSELYKDLSIKIKNKFFYL